MIPTSSAEELKAYIDCEYTVGLYCGKDRLIFETLELLKEQEAVEPKTGHWIYKKYDDMFMCSSCKKYSIQNDYPYCHWCGAKMEKEGQ